MDAKQTTAGFTLLEVVIAIAVIATGFMGVYSLHLETLEASNDVRFYIKAPLLARQKIAELDAGVATFEDSSGDFGEDHVGYSWKIAGEEIESDLLGTSAEKFKKMNIEVILNEGVNTHSVVMYRYVHDAES